MTRRRGALAAALAWMLVVLAFSTSSFEAERTEALLRPALSWLVPHLDAETVRAINRRLRTAAHVAEYAILAGLWMAALSADAGRQPRHAMLIVLAICVTCALVDEANQALTAGRAGKLTDVAVDASGAAVGIMLRRMRDRWREPASRRLLTSRGPAARESAAVPADGRADRRRRDHG